MKQDKLYKSGEVREDFTFNDQVAEVFDDMLDRSVPFYAEVIGSIAEIVRRYGIEGTTVYDLGCATGTTLLELVHRLPDISLKYTGIDNAPAMIDKARRKADQFARGSLVRFVEGDITATDMPDAGIILCNYTMQFVRPLTRPEFVKRIYDALPAGGLFIVSEKVINHDKELNRSYIDIYHRFKKRQGYSELEIAAKREALENVLIPCSIKENLDLLKNTGFTSSETFFQWFNFASFIAVK